MNRVFIDVNIPMYAAGTPHPLREPSQRVIMAIATGRLDAVTDAEVLQEILYRYLHIGEREKGFMVFDHFYLAVMKRHQVEEILTADTAFDKIEQVRRIDPGHFPPES